MIIPFLLYSGPSRKLLRLFCSLLLAALCVGAGAEAPFPPRIVVLLAPGLRAEDLARPELPVLRRLMARSASGWMVCRAARVLDRSELRPDGRETTDSLALTLGAGSRAVVPPDIAAVAPLVDPQDKAASVLPAGTLQALQEANARLDHPVPVGALGDLFHAGALQTALIGSMEADTPDSAPFLMAMDSNGRVDFAGRYLAAIVPDPTAPYGLRTDRTAMLRALDRLPERVALRVLVFGDVLRADRYAPLCLPAIAAAHRAAALRSLDDLLAALDALLYADAASAAEGGTRLLLLAPGPPDSSREREDRLAPIFASGREFAPGSRWITSASTRRAGLVVNTDLLATVATMLNRPLPPGATGRPMAVAPDPTLRFTGLPPPSSEALASVHADLLQTARLQDTFGGLPTVQMLLVLAGMVALVRRVVWVVRATAVAIVALPLEMLLLPVLPLHNVWMAGGLLAVVTLLLTVLADLVDLITLLCLLLVLAVLADLVTGSHLLRQAWMSYSVVEGARFYGIGNEYMGAVIGAACVLLATLYPCTLANWRNAFSPQRHKDTKKGEGKHCYLTPVEGTAVGALEGAASSAPTVLAEGEQLELVHTHSPGTEVPGLEAKSAEVDSTLPISLAGADRGWVWIALFFGVLIVAMGWLGAKVGAVPSAGVAFGVALVVLRRGRLRARELGMVLVGAGLLLAALAFLDMRHAAGEQSHLGRALSGAGGGSLLGIARRKLLLEGYLLLHSPWSLTLAVCAVGLAWLWRRDRVYLFGGPAPVAAYAAFAGLVAGALAAVLCNDSGVTAAVLILLYGWAWTNWRYAPGVGR